MTLKDGTAIVQVAVPFENVSDEDGIGEKAANYVQEALDRVGITYNDVSTADIEVEEERPDSVSGTITATVTLTYNFSEVEVPEGAESLEEWAAGSCLNDVLNEVGLMETDYDSADVDSLDIYEESDNDGSSDDDQFYISPPPTDRMKIESITSGWAGNTAAERNVRAAAEEFVRILGQGLDWRREVTQAEFEAYAEDARRQEVANEPSGIQ
jgi:hypothetical protein